MHLLASHWLARQPHEHPYRWLAFEPGELLERDAAATLCESFPTQGYVRTDTSSRTTGKTYRNYSRELIAPGGHTDLALPQPWRDLVDDVLSSDYRRAVAALLGQEPAPAIEVRLVRHAEGDWLAPHTDRADKLFSHTIYFSLDWQESWGGHLEILDAPPDHTVVARIPPVLGASALLARSDTSWHQVSRVAVAGGSERRSLLVHGLHG